MNESRSIEMFVTGEPSCLSSMAPVQFQKIVNLTGCGIGEPVRFLPGAKRIERHMVESIAILISDNLDRPQVVAMRILEE